MWLQKLLGLFLIFFFVANLGLPNYSYAGQNLKENTPITTNDFQYCLEELEACNEGYEKIEASLAKCMIKADRQKVLFFFDAESLGYLAIGLLMGIVI